MGDLVEQLSNLSGVSVEAAAVLISLLALVLLVGGTGLLVVSVFGRWADAAGDNTASRLMPTLVEDILDQDLQQVYRQALLLDRLVDDKFSELGGPTGTRLGRRARRFVVRLQAKRFSSRKVTSHVTSHQKSEPPDGEARFDEVSKTVEQGVEWLVGAPAGSKGEAARLLEELDARLRHQERRRA